jgi:chemotaxis protein methyltransferase CheR
MNAPLERIAALVEGESGIQVKEPQVGALSAALGRVSPGMDADRFLDALDDPAQRALLLGRLIDQVAIQETYFMREPRELEAVDWQQLLEAAHARGAGEVNVWVAACASGEEAYSVAMLATEAFGHTPPPVAILATDISMAALRRAEEGVYSERSIRDLSPTRRDRFLIRDGPRSAVGEQLRSLVRLRRHNLVADPAPPAGEVRFDLILCRNVLIYFDSQNVETVIGSLESALQPRGRLILGASDRLGSSARRLGEIAIDEFEPAAALRSRTPARRAGASRSRALRRPLGRAGRAPTPAVVPSAPPGGDMDAALKAANKGEYAAAIESAGRALAADPLNAEAHYVRGLSELATDDPAAAVESLRRALYVDPTFALAAFQLARAHELSGDQLAARRAYGWTLQALSRGDQRSRGRLDRVEIDDVAAACRARLAEAGNSREA